MPPQCVTSDSMPGSRSKRGETCNPKALTSIVMCKALDNSFLNNRNNIAIASIQRLIACSPRRGRITRTSLSTQFADIFSSCHLLLAAFKSNTCGSHTYCVNKGHNPGSSYLYTGSFVFCFFFFFLGRHQEG